MADKRCILNGSILNKLNNSKAHIIPSAIGGRLKPKNILSKEANEELNYKFDKNLCKAFSEIMSLVNGSRDSGQNLSLPLHSITESKISNNEISIEVQAKDLKWLRICLGKLKKQYPELNIHSALNKRENIVGTINYELCANIGPIVTFPAAFVMASLFAATNEMPVHHSFKDYVKNFDINKPSMPPDTFYFCNLQNIFKTKAELGHNMFYFGDYVNARALFYLELFNMPGIAVKMPFCAKKDVYFSYSIGILNGKEVNLDLEKNALKQLKWEATHILGDEALFEKFRFCLDHIINFTMMRQFKLIVKGILNIILKNSSLDPTFKNLLKTSLNSIRTVEFSQSHISEFYALLNTYCNNFNSNKVDDQIFFIILAKTIALSLPFNSTGYVIDA